MDREIQLFAMILILNTVVALEYFVWAVFFRNVSKEEGGLARYLIRTVIMLLCPVIGALFFLFGNLFYHLFFFDDVDLEDVVFNKDRVEVHMKADEERGRNIVPLEEAIAVSDKGSLRTLMLNVVRGDIQKSLSAIALALNSEDSETSHYAASVLRDELNDFRATVQKIYQEIEEENETEDKAECAVMLMDYMNSVLKQNVFGSMEQSYFVRMLERTGEILYQCKKEAMTQEHFENICLRLLEIEAFEECERWCKRGKETYPEQLSSYTCLLKLYFTISQKEKFFAVMEELKHSKVIIDSETLELIRIFS